MKLKGLNTKYLGRNVIYYKSIDSTQLEMWRRLKNDNTENGTLILSDIQTTGQGTHGRLWHTDLENNIAFTILIHTNCDVKKLDGITVEIANIIAGVLKEDYDINLQIKYPNDIVFKNKKIGGILTQTKVNGKIAKELVIGIGLNTIQMDFSNDIKEIATSIKKEFNIDVDREKIIADFCNVFEIKLLNRLGE